MLQETREKVGARVKSLISDLLSCEPKESWDELEYKEIGELGYLAWLNEDNGGSFSIFVIKEKELPFIQITGTNPFWVMEEEGRKIDFTSFKVVMKEDWINKVPKGTVYSELVDNLYTQKEDFTNEKEVIQILTEKIVDLVKE
jgi:hypothetical protein